MNFNLNGKLVFSDSCVFTINKQLLVGKWSVVAQDLGQLKGHPN